MLHRVLDWLISALLLALFLICFILPLVSCAPARPSPAAQAAAECARLQLSSPVALDNCQIVLAQSFTARQQTCRRVGTFWGWETQCD